MSKASKSFFIMVMVISAAVCVGACMSGGELAYGSYLIFLTVSGFGGAFLISMLIWLITQKDEAEARMAKIRIAELERAVNNLEEVADRREEFTASFAHELKTPLTAIIGYADMLRSKDMPPKQRFTAAGYIFSEGKRLEALSLKLMDIIVAGKQEFEKKRCDVGYFIREVATVTVPSLSAEGITLDMRWDRGDVTIEPDLFKTLIINLVDNSRKASRRGQSIELYGKAEAGGYALFVKDTGSGMKADELAHITEPFYMIDKSRSRAQNGAGLGLALCRRIAELHGTNLEYKSEPGKGTTVRIFLPGGESD
ncbi:MAG: HAMP domain-containing histidine kinase [Oscillospiraceae bacterium]|nr:HAMP domain-containing histidine kinase [Oscillospiraceae bacterium]